MASQMSNATSADSEDAVSIEDMEQLCTRMSKYDPCFRLSLIQHHLKRMGISCADERLVKLLSLSFETMVNPYFKFISRKLFFILDSIHRHRLCACKSRESFSIENINE